MSLWWWWWCWWWWWWSRWRERCQWRWRNRWRWRRWCWWCWWWWGSGVGGGPFAWKITWCPWAAPGILAKARRLQLADASFREFLRAEVLFHCRISTRQGFNWDFLALLNSDCQGVRHPYKKLASNLQRYASDLWWLIAIRAWQFMFQSEMLFDCIC